MTNSEILIQTLMDIWEELRSLCSEQEWAALEEQLLFALRSIDASPDDKSRTTALLEVLKKYPAAHERFVQVAIENDMQYRGYTNPLTRKKERYTIVPVYYATDRNRTTEPGPYSCYGGEHGRLAYGCIEVGVPDDHRTGMIEKPRWMRLEFREDPNRHIVLLAQVAMSRDDWTHVISAQMPNLATPEILLFIHGYNVTFDDAARQTAQIAYDLQFPGVPMLYSWPSEGQIPKYLVDEDNANWTVDQFEDFLRHALCSLSATKLHVVAHSMGNRVLTEGIRRLDPETLPPSAARLQEVMFAAPDVNADSFRKFAVRFQSRANRFTLYASTSDLALGLSKKFHKYPRAGDLSDGVIIADGMDTIDATNVDTSLLGHSYVGDNDSILSDIFNLLRYGHKPMDRFGLEERIIADSVYWAFSRRKGR